VNGTVEKRDLGKGFQQPGKEGDKNIKGVAAREIVTPWDRWDGQGGRVVVNNTLCRGMKKIKKRRIKKNTDAPELEGGER